MQILIFLFNIIIYKNMVSAFYIIETSKLSQIVFPQVGQGIYGYKLSVSDFSTTRKNGIDYSYCATFDVQIGENNLSQFIAIPTLEFESWLSTLPNVEIKSVTYDWETNQVKIICSNGRIYRYVNETGSTWTPEYCQQKISEEVFAEDAVLVLPVDMAEQLQVMYSQVKAVLLNDSFRYPTKFFENASTKYIELVPILFAKIDEGDTDLIQIIANDWNSNPLNVDRQLPSQILFNNGFEYFNTFKENILT